MCPHLVLVIFAMEASCWVGLFFFFYVLAHLAKIILFSFFPATGFRFQFYSDVPDGVRRCYSVNDLFTVMFKNGHKGYYSLIYSFLEIVDSYLD